MADTVALPRVADTVGWSTIVLCAATLLTAHGCHASRPAAVVEAGPSCRDVARHAEEVIAQTPERARDNATRFYAEVIDLCQEPGLAQRARSCLVAAGDVKSARGCPSLPATADTAEDADESESGPPSCRTIAEHAMRLLSRDADAPVSPADRAEEEYLFLRDCAAATPEGRNCAAKAISVDAIDECLSMPANDGGDGLDDDNPTDDGPD